VTAGAALIGGAVFLDAYLDKLGGRTTTTMDHSATWIASSTKRQTTTITDDSGNDQHRKKKKKITASRHYFFNSSSLSPPPAAGPNDWRGVRLKGISDVIPIPDVRWHTYDLSVARATLLIRQ